MKAVRFFQVVWQTGIGFTQTTEAAPHRRYLVNQIKGGEVAYYDEDGKSWSLVKIQELETPMIEEAWFIDLFTTGSTKKEREAHREQMQYVLRMITACAARVALANGDFIERI